MRRKRRKRRKRWTTRTDEGRDKKTIKGNKGLTIFP